MHGRAEDAATAGFAKLGFAQGQIVQEIAWDEDCDEAVRLGIEAVIGVPLEDEEYGDGADAALVWFRAEDGDLVDTLVDALTNLVDNGFLVLCTPRAGQAGDVEPSDIDDAALTAGLHTAGVANVSRAWTATRLVAPKSQRR